MAVDPRDRRWERSNLERHGLDFLSQVREVCRLRMDQDRSTAGAEIIEREHGAQGARFDHLVVRYTRGPWSQAFVVGTWDGQPDGEVVRRFARGVCAHVGGTERVPELVYRGSQAGSDAERAARESQVWLRGFPEYQDVWDYDAYVTAQTQRLRADPEYPLHKHVDKRWSELGERDARPSTAGKQIMDWLDTDGPRFVLVLGDFGTGKTFLLRALAERLAGQLDDSPGLAPVLVTMRELTKGRTLDQLLAQHMSEVDSYHRASFRYLLRQGRIALLFDGFDELAQRTDYARVVDHFNTLREAAGGSAKVIVTSRHQYFATDRDVRTALGGQAQSLPGSRIMRLLPLNSSQRREMVVEDFDDEAAADRFLRLLGGVRDLIGLARNPRMLSFMISWYRAGLLTDKELAASDGEPITAGRLYERLLTTWLEHEFKRQDEPGGPGALSVDERLDALGEVALRLWRSGVAAVPAADLGSTAAKVANLARLRMTTGQAALTVGASTVLVRVGEDAFSFIHQSVQEWLVARWVAQAFNEPSRADVHDRLSSGQLNPLTVDFLCDLAGVDPVAGWARGVVHSGRDVEPMAKANASLILQNQGITVRSANYAGADLQGRDLSSQDFTRADLREADLSGAVLPRTLRGADARGASLVAARLSGADLTQADLQGADLSRAWLVGSDLTGARLAGARLDRAVLIGAALDHECLASAVTSMGVAAPDSMAEVQRGPGSPVSAVVAFGDSAILVTGHADGTVRVWDANTGTTLRTLQGHTSRVNALAVHPQGHWLATASDDGTVRVWNPNTGTLRTLRGHTSRVNALAVHPQGHWLATGHTDGIVRLWDDPNTGTTLRTLQGHTSEVNALAVYPQGHWLATASNDGTVRLWDANTGTTLRTLQGHTSRVNALAVHPQGHWLATANFNGIVRLWHSYTGTTLHTLEGHTSTINALAVYPQGHWLATASNDGTVRLWDANTGTTLSTLQGPTHLVYALTVHPQGQWLATASDDGTVRLWDPNSGTTLNILQGHTNRVNALTFHPQGHWLATASDDGTVRLWDANTGTTLRTLQGPTHLVYALTVHPQGHWLATASNDGTVRLWDPNTGTLHTLHGHTHLVYALTVDPQGHWLATGHTDGTVRLWDPNTGTTLYSLQGHTSRINALTVDPQGHWLATGHTDGTVRLWDPNTGTTLYSLQGHTSRINALTVDPQGHWLATASNDGTVQLWDPNTGTTLYSLQGHTSRINALTVDPQGHWLATGHTDGTVRLWDPNTGTTLDSLQGHTSEVNALAVDPQGHWLATASNDGTVRLWDPNTGTLRTLQGHTSRVNALTVDPQGRWLASASNDGTVRLWDPHTRRLLVTLVASAEGWAALLPDGRFKLHGRPAGLWWAAGLCRFDAADLPELAQFQPHLRPLPDDAPLIDVS